MSEAMVTPARQLACCQRGRPRRACLSLPTQRSTRLLIARREHAGAASWSPLPAGVGCRWRPPTIRAWRWRAGRWGCRLGGGQVRCGAAAAGAVVMIRGLARELLPNRIRVDVAGPGPINAGILEGSFSRGGGRSLSVRT